MKKYKVGMYGGKFMPFHKGHMYCIDYAVKQCEKLYVILFYGGDDEIRILKELPNESWLLYKNRLKRINNACKKYRNVEVCAIDVTKCKKADGTEDWDQETELVLDICGKMDAVYASEPQYKEYFDRAYPWAKFEIVDVKRNNVPISGTAIRNMKTKEERERWMV